MLVTVKFNSLAEANYWCAGAVVGAVRPHGNFQNLVGKTITFTAPAGSCTFTQPTADAAGLMDFAAVQSQIQTAIANLKVLANGENIVFLNSSGAAVTLASANEPARAALGLPNNAAIAGIVLNPPGGGVPTFVGLVPETNAIYITYNK